VQLTHTLDRWLYRGGRPNRLARFLNRGGGLTYGAGLWPKRLGTLEVPGRRTGRLISFPVVIADHGGERYLVAMLGEDANWPRNVRATGGRAVLRHGRREAVRLDEVDPAVRAPIIRRYVAVAPGARPHIPVDRHAPVEAFEPIAPRIPVFRITSDAPAREPAGPGSAGAPAPDTAVRPPG
jgi:F420H(2)-dependent quinone reductase